MYLAGVDVGLIVKDLQGACDPRVPVRMAPWRPVQVKDHQAPVASRQVQELLQRGNRQVLRLRLLLGAQGLDGTKRVPLQQRGNTHTRPMGVGRFKAAKSQEPLCSLTHPSHRREKAATHHPKHTPLLCWVYTGTHA